MIRSRLFRADRTPGPADAAAWPSLCRDDANLLWVDLEAPTDDEVAQVVERFGVQPSAAALARREQRRPLVRKFGDHYVVTVLAIEVDETPAVPRIAVIELDAFVGRNFLVSLHHRPLPFAKTLDERTAANPQLGRYDSAYLLYVLLDTLVAHYSEELDEIEEEVERLEEQLLRAPGRRPLDQAMIMKRHLQAVRRLVAPHREAFGSLITTDSPVPEHQIEAYFRDLVVHVNGLLDRLDHARDIVTGSYNLYLSNIGFRTNQQLRVLTYLSAVLLPMTVITGMFGTNFALAEYGSWEPFYVMLAGMALITAGMLAFFRWRRWL